MTIRGLLQGGSMEVFLNKKRKNTVCFKVFSIFLAANFSLTLLFPIRYSHAQVISGLPIPGAMVSLSPGFIPTIMRGVKIHLDNPLQFDFIIDRGNARLKGKALENESQKLVRYFLTALTVPEKDLWVNLSPYEDQHIIPQAFGITEMGRDLLAQDYFLKQLTASLIYPEDGLGKEFWDKIYKKAYELYGTTQIPVNTFNKVWIVPEKAVVYERGDTAFVAESYFKVLLEEDYLALKNNLQNAEKGTDQLLDEEIEEISGVSSDIVKEIIIPELEKEINEGKNFGLLRQIFHSLILATWYKRTLKESLLGKIYVDQNKVTGVDVEDKAIKERIYEQYVEAYRKGVYNFVQEEFDPIMQTVIPRKYFSGGMGLALKENFEVETQWEDLSAGARRDFAMLAGDDDGRFVDASFRFEETQEGASRDTAMLVVKENEIENQIVDGTCRISIGVIDEEGKKRIGEEKQKLKEEGRFIQVTAEEVVVGKGVDTKFAPPQILLDALDVTYDYIERIGDSDLEEIVDTTTHIFVMDKDFTAEEFLWFEDDKRWVMAAVEKKDEDFGEQISYLPYGLISRLMARLSQAQKSGREQTINDLKELIARIIINQSETAWHFRGGEGRDPDWIDQQEIEWIASQFGEARTIPPPICPLCLSERIKVIHHHTIDGKVVKEHECERCKMVFKHPMFTDDEIKSMFDGEGYYESGDTTIAARRGYAQYGDEQTDRQAQSEQYLAMLEEVNKSEGAQDNWGERPKLFDVGAGYGALVKAAQAKGWKAEGNEVSKHAIKQAKERGVELMRGDLSELDLSEGSYDVVTLFNILQHVRDPKAMIQQAKRILKDDGFLMVKVPVVDSQLGFSQGVDFFKEDQMYHFSVQAISQMLIEQGFEIVKGDMEKAHNVMILRKKPEVAEERRREQLSVSEILTEDHLALRYTNVLTGEDMTLREKFEQLDNEYREVLANFANAAKDPSTGRETDNEAIIRANQLEAEKRRMGIVQQLYDIGEAALDLDDAPPAAPLHVEAEGKTYYVLRPEYAKNYLVAMLAFKNVREMQPLTKVAYGEAVFGTEYKPADDATPSLMTLDKAIELGFEKGEDFEKYVESLEKIKDAEQLYIDSYQRYLSVIEERSTIAIAAVENIKYDLGIDDEYLFWGINKQNGRSFQELWEMAVTLRAILLHEDENKVSSGMRVQAAAYLDRLFTKYFYRGIAARGIDHGGGLSVPKELEEAIRNAKEEELKKWELDAFTTFAFPGDQDTLNGSSWKAMTWLVAIYRTLLQQYYSKSVADALQLEAERYSPQLALAKERLKNVLGSIKEEDFSEIGDGIIESLLENGYIETTHETENYKLKEEFKKVKKASDLLLGDLYLGETEAEKQEKREEIYKVLQKAQLEEMKRIFEEHFKKAISEFRNGSTAGLVVEKPVRVELGAGPPKDSAFLSTYLPGHFKILNYAGLLTREDGTVGRNIQIGIEIRDLEEMPMVEVGDEEKRALITVESLDMSFKEFVTGAEDLTTRNKATLILDTLASKGLLPKEMMALAVEAGKETQEEILGFALEHFLGKGKGLEITLHVREIAPGSGLAVSSLLAMGVATAFDVLVGEPYDRVDERVINRLKMPVSEIGMHEVELSLDMDFSDEDTVFTYSSQAVDGTIEIDVDSNAMDGAGQYYFRVKKEGAQRWGTVRQVKVKAEIEELREVTKDSSTIENERFVKKLQRRDDATSISRSIGNSQETIWEQDGKAGTQDEVAGSGKMLLLTAGLGLRGKIKGRDVHFRGGVVPTMMEVSLSEKARERINRGIRVLRVGLTEAAEDTLDEVFGSLVVNAGFEQGNAWAQITLEMLKAAQLGDIVEMGRLAHAAVSLREKLAPVSINPVVLRVLEKMKQKYGASVEDGGVGFSYGITGARSTGSVLLFFDPNLEESRIAEVMREVTTEMQKAIELTGKQQPIEDDAQVYKKSRMATQGTTVWTLDKEEAERRRKRVIAPLREKLEKEHAKKKEKYALYTSEDIKGLRVNEEQEIPEMYEEQLLTVHPKLAQQIQEFREENPDAPLDMVQIRAWAKEIIREEYEPFRAAGANREVRDLVRNFISRNTDVIKDAELDAEEQRLLFLAIGQGKVDLLWIWQDQQEVRDIVESLKKEEGLDKISQQYKDQREKLREILDGGAQSHERRIQEGEIDGEGFVTKNFLKSLEEEKEELKNEIKDLEKNILEAQERNQVIVIENMEWQLLEKKLLLETLEWAPNPEALGYGHFLFDLSKTYNKFFKKYMDALENAVEEGAIVLGLPTGGVGARAFGGNRVKIVTPWHDRVISDNTYLGGNIDGWAEFLERFPPDRVDSFLHSVHSAFTAAPVKAALPKLVSKAGLEMNNIGNTSQTVRPVLFLKEDESDQNFDMEYHKSDRFKRDRIREYNRMKRDGIRRALSEAEDRQEGDEELIRPRFDRPGLSELNRYNPSGNAGILEGVITENAEVYTLDNLRESGYEIDEEAVTKMLSVEDDALRAELQRELDEGMPLAKASLLVKGKGLSVFISQNSSSRAPVGGGDLALGEAVDALWEDENVIAKWQYANMAGSVTFASPLVRKKNGVITSLEGNRLQFGEEVVLEDDYTAASTGTIDFNLKKIWKLGGYDDSEQYLVSTQDQRRQRMDHQMNEVYDKTYAVRERTEEQVGLSEKWLVLQTEVPLPYVLEWAQEKYGKESVQFQETTAAISYQDDKTRQELRDGLDRKEHWRANKMKTVLPDGDIEDAEVTISDYLYRAKFHLKNSMTMHAAEAIERAKVSLASAKQNFGEDKANSYAKKIEAFEEELKEKSGDQRFVEHVKYDTKSFDDEDFLDLHRIQNDVSFDLYERIKDEEELGDVKAHLAKLIRKIVDEEKILTDMCEWLDVKELMRVISEILGQDASEDLGKVILTELVLGEVLGDEAGDVLEKIFKGQKKIARSKIREINSALTQMHAPESPMWDALVQVTYMRRELTALYDQIVDALLDLNGTKVTEHKVLLPVDKDATIDDPGEPAKQIVSLADLRRPLNPNRGVEIALSAIRGADAHILTGASAKEGAQHICSVVASVLNQLHIPSIMKKMAVKRIKVLAADGTVIVRMKADESGYVTPDYQIIPNQKYEDGKWVEARTLKLSKKENGRIKEDKSNRIKVWNVSIRAYLHQLFKEKRLQDVLGFPENPDQRASAQQQFHNFIDMLEMREEDIPDIEDMDPREYQNVIEPISWAVQKMLDNWVERQGPVEEWKKRVDQIFRSADSANEKLFGDNKEELTADEELYAALRLLNFKDCTGTFGSVSGDPLDKKQHDPRVSGLSEIVLNRAFWKSTKEYLDEQFERLRASGNFMTQVGEPIPSEVRAGPGYLNISFGGASKINYLGGLLQDWQTKGKVVLIMGDSITDQGNFPFVSTVTLEIKGNIVNLDVVPKQIANKMSIEEEKNKVKIEFEGRMSWAEYETLRRLSDTNEWKEAIDQLYNQSVKVHDEKIVLRLLLGSLFEMHAVDRDKRMQAGLLRNQYMFSEPNPFGDGVFLERWGPVGFYWVVKALMDVAKQNYVIPEGEMIEMRDRVVRGMIDFLNHQPVRGFRIVPPDTTKKTEKSSARRRQRRRIRKQVLPDVLPDVAMMIDPTTTGPGGIDLTLDNYNLQIKRDQQGIPLPIHLQDTERIHIDGFFPIMINITPINNMPFLLGIAEVEDAPQVSLLSEN